MTTDITPLPPNLPGNETPADKAIAEKVNQVVPAVNAQADAQQELEQNMAAVTRTIADLTIRVTELEEGEPEPPDPGPGPGPEPEPTPTPPPLPMARVLGPYPDYVQASAAHPSFAKYLSMWKTLEATRWGANAPDSANWGNTNYYDRANIDYAFSIMTGDAVLMDHAHQQALNYRAGYLEAAKYLINAHWSMMDGVAGHFLSTGDEKSRFAVGQIGDLFTGLGYRDSIGVKGATDCRIQARYLVAVLLAYHLNAPSTGVEAGGIPGGHNWANELRRALPLILRTQDEDGGWRLSECGDGGPLAYHPFPTGLLLDGLARYYDTFEKDPAIPEAIALGSEFLWREAWMPSDLAFKYIERVCPNEGGPGPAPDLNGIMLRGFSFTYRMGKDSVWRDRTLQILAGAFNAWLSPDKQINQTYTAGYRAIADLL